VGKTTLSRIFAKALNCEKGVSSTPCGVCRACREIDEGRFIDYVEMDAASNRGVDEMAALLERAVYAPVDARFKVYMIDEVHMLTNHAFNAMLKTLEEPPPHVKFILATTDPQKIPVTVLSRCLQFNLKQMPAGAVVTHLEHILGEENIAYESQALRLLARAADGSMRDALSLTDQAIAYSSGQITEEAVRGMLGALDQSYLIRLIDTIIAQDGAAVLAIADEMALRSLSFSTALQDLAGLFHRVAWAQFAPSSVLDEWPEAADLRRFAAAMNAQQVQLCYQIATVGRSELGLAPDEYAGFTMTLLRMLAFEPSARNTHAGHVPSSGAAITATTTTTTATTTATRTMAAPAMAAASIATLPPAASAAAQKRGGASEALDMLRNQKNAQKNTTKNVTENTCDAGAKGGVKSRKIKASPASTLISAAPSLSAAASAVAPWEDLPAAPGGASLSAGADEPAARPAIALDAVGFSGDWPTLVEDLSLTGIAHQLAFNSELSLLDGATLKLAVPVAQYADAPHVAKLKAALAEKFGKPVDVQVEVGPARDTAAARQNAARAQRQRDAEQEIGNAPFVQQLIREFGASIVAGSVKPLDAQQRHEAGA
jgi:DNA polymerase-3 subunit gamma/tau